MVLKVGEYKLSGLLFGGAKGKDNDDDEVADKVKTESWMVPKVRTFVSLY